MNKFNESLGHDKRMYDVDVRGSIAYSKALTLVGILTKDEEDKIVKGLEAVKKEWDDGVVSPSSVGITPLEVRWGLREVEQFQVQPDDEDIYTANERRLTELIGPLGGKLHTGRSRNDQAATDMRLWLMEEAREIEIALRALIQVIVKRADNEREFLMPGYTHLQVHLCNSIISSDQLR
jgi:argininosuccinate lyase